MDYEANKPRFDLRGYSDCGIYNYYDFRFYKTFYIKS